MPTLQGTVKDAAGRPAAGTVRIKALHVREGSGGAVIDERTFDLPILNGTITGSPVLEPGPAKITLNVSGGRLRAWDVNIPPDTSIDLWDLIESQVHYEPPVISRVTQERVAAEAAADRAEAAADSVEDVSADAAQVAADRAAVESVRTEVESNTTTASTAASTASSARDEAVNARAIAVEARDDAVIAKDAALVARDQAEDFTALAGASTTTALEYAEAAADSAAEAAGYVGSVLDGAITTPKLADDAVTTSKLAPDVRADLAGRQDVDEKGQANGYAPLDAGAKVPAAHLPSYVDDVVEYANQGGFPATGETGKIYTALDTNRIYRWSGSGYVEISPSPGSTDAVPEGATNRYYTDARAQAANAAAIGAKYTKPASGIPASDLATGRVVGAVNGAATNLTIWVGTEAQYTALATKEPNTLYFRTA